MAGLVVPWLMFLAHIGVSSDFVKFSDTTKTRIAVGTFLVLIAHYYALIRLFPRWWPVMICPFTVLLLFDVLIAFYWN